MGFERKEYHSFLANVAVERYRAVKLHTTANEVVYADPGQTEGVFITQNAAAAGSPVTCLPLPAAGGTFKVTASAAIDLGARVAPTGIVGKVAEAAGASGIAIALEAAAGDDEEIVCTAIAGGGVSTQSQAVAGTALVNDDTETALATKTIPGASLKVGDVIEVIAAVLVVDNNGADTLTLELMLGTEVIVATAAVDVEDNDIGFIHAFITIRAIGAAGSLVAAGHAVLDAPGTLSTKFMKAVAAEDISGDVAVKLDATWSAAHADNECVCETFIVKHHKAA